MAHDRAKRFPKLITQTPPKIGPGTYDGGVSIDFTDARFKEHVSDGPGPVYNVAKSILKSRKIRSHPGTWKGSAGNLWLTTPPRSIIPNPVSVPNKSYTGYNINEYGNLVKNPPTKHLQAEFYNVPREETNTTTLIYRGNFWSRMTGRTEPRISLTPGPGDYEHEAKKTPAEIQNERVKEERRMTCRQTRYLDAMWRMKMRENFPAPNSYKVKGSFDRFMKIACKCDPYILEPPPFGRTAKRFDDKAESDVPGPGTYDPPVGIKCVGSILPAPFSVCASRFKKDPEDSGPGPSDYNLVVGNLAYESEKRFKYSYMRQLYPQVSFNSMFLFNDDDDIEDTNIPEKTEEKKSNVYHAAFKSRTDRFPKPEKMDVPDPGAYEVLTSFKTNRNKCDFFYAPLAPAFGTRSSRLLKKYSDHPTDTPDPTTYELAGDISKNVKGGVISISRSKFKMSAAPPPTRYCIHPYVSSCITKKSFNSSLGKSELVKKLEEEKKPFKPRCPCKKKKLRWFAVTLHEKRSCRPISF